MPAEKPRRYSAEDYLKIADDSEVKLEYIDGQIVSMAAGGANHSLMIINIGDQIRRRVKESLSSS